MMAPNESRFLSFLIQEEIYLFDEDPLTNEDNIQDAVAGKDQAAGTGVQEKPGPGNESGSGKTPSREVAGGSPSEVKEPGPADLKGSETGKPKEGLPAEVAGDHIEEGKADEASEILRDLTVIILPASYEKERTTKDNELLTKMLHAVNVPEEQVRTLYVDPGDNPENLFRDHTFRNCRIILFSNNMGKEEGKILPDSYYQTRNMEDSVILLSHAPDFLHTHIDHKKALWEQLKLLYGIGS